MKIINNLIETFLIIFIGIAVILSEFLYHYILEFIDRLGEKNVNN